MNDAKSDVNVVEGVRAGQTSSCLVLHHTMMESIVKGSDTAVPSFLSRDS